MSVSGVRDDGGLAFPFDMSESCGIDPRSTTGMTLRDWFAGQALAGMLANNDRNSDDASDYAHDAYAFADAMLKARKN